MRNDHEQNQGNGCGRRAPPTKDERIRNAAMKLGPRFTAEDIASALKGRYTVMEIGRRLSNADYVRLSGKNRVSRANEWELVEAEAR